MRGKGGVWRHIVGGHLGKGRGRDNSEHARLLGTSFWSLIRRRTILGLHVTSWNSKIPNWRAAKLLSSSGRRGANFISVYNISAQQDASFGNQGILNFRVMAVRDINLWSCLAKKYVIISAFFGPLRSKRIRESVYVNVCIFSTDNHSLRSPK